MGYSDFANFKLLDGYSLNITDGYSFTSNWVDIHSVPNFNVSCVFTGNSPAGTLKLQQSNSLQFQGGNRAQPQPSVTGGDPIDVKDVPTGNGTASVSVSGAGTYLLDQHFAGFRWFRVVYTHSSNVATTVDLFVNWKKS